MWRVALLLMAVIALNACAPAAPPPAIAGPPAAEAAPDPALAAELERLRARFAAETGAARQPDPAGREQRIARARAALEASFYRPAGPELVVAVDRHPEVQVLSVLLARPEGGWEVVGESLVSTGASGRRGHFLTPTGVFLHTDAILDYRALGKRNALGVRGLGARGMRVWDFGWLTAEKGWREDGETGEIRFLLHATDPDLLEPRLGRPASQGCVRIPSGVNRFLDLEGVLDVDHERAARAGDARFAALLHPARTPSPLAGRALIVVDSREAPPGEARDAMR
ncbi:MAG: hypothetical protein N3D18_06080 [Roseococcus sp.]|nr:hypothetical protein [Roseococcus sp.]